MIPSVTQVLSPYQNFDRVRQTVLKTAAERGTIVHRLCVGIARRLFIQAPEELCGYVTSFQSWWYGAVDSLVAAEEKFIDHRLGYCGHPDLVVKIAGDDVLTVVDLKTPSAVGKTWACQLAAYGHLIGAGRILSLRLKPNGSPPIINEFTDKQGYHFAAFCAALSVWRYFNGD